MTNTNHLQVMRCEENLLSAMRNGDDTALDHLLHNDLQFVIPGGMVVTKAMDIDLYRSGQMTVNYLAASEQVIYMLGDCAVVTVLIDLKAKYMDQLIDGVFRFIRVWKSFDGFWQVIAGSSSLLQVPGKVNQPNGL